MCALVTCLIAFISLAAAPSIGLATEERIELFELVTSAPLPAGYTAKRQDFQNPDGSGSTLILLTNPATKSRVQVTIEKQKLATKEEKVAAFKRAVNGIHGLFTKRGYKTVEMEHPDSKTLDPEKRLDLRLKMAKDGKVLAVDAEVFFTDQAYTVWAVTHDEAERNALKTWIATVRPK